MSSDDIKWQWDAGRLQWYWFSTDRQAYIYHDGTEIVEPTGTQSVGIQAGYSHSQLTTDVVAGTPT